MWKHKDDALYIVANLIDEKVISGKDAVKLTIAILMDTDRLPISFIDGEPIESPKKTPEVDYEKLIITPEPPLSNPVPARIPSPKIGEIKIGDVCPDPWPVTYDTKPDGFVNQYQTNAEECRMYGQTITTKEIPHTYTTVAGDVSSEQIVMH
jgi:hypothetical protein